MPVGALVATREGVSPGRSIDSQLAPDGRHGVQVVQIAAGIALVVVAFADLVNTLVTTSTSYARGWPTHALWTTLYGGVRRVAARMPETSRVRERLLAAFAPLLLIALLTMWATMQVTGFALVWHAVGGVQGVAGFGDALYYSGVVFFTVGFGEVVPAAEVPRAGAIVEAFAGVVTTALVIGYLPSLYGAYSEREQQLISLDDGSQTRITPMSLIMAWSPDADPSKLEERFREWETWVARIHETHATLPLLRLFRSHDQRQHWVTALGVVTDAALLAQGILGAYDGHGYWLVRRSTALFDELARFAPAHVIQRYRGEHAAVPADLTRERMQHVADRLTEHGFDLVPLDMGMEHFSQLRANYAPQMEYLIDHLLAPRGFWPPEGLDVPLLSTTNPDVLFYMAQRDDDGPTPAIASPTDPVSAPTERQ